MEEDWVIIILVLVFGLTTTGFIMLVANYDIFAFILIIAMAISYLFGRFWERKVIKKLKGDKK